ncbi:MAG: four helix bundle protein [Gracilimonas sp.]|uniref:four helix bundle protein n=1 Tax=Gracilimonas TaxID=649462 RepID=UPI001B2760A2|nr:four helix bundle protein [Gracilimonas sp.]MBO6584550.1 four helix bundle protein [Gracilimonas sp.]MBO6616179.1 four helix bundle protein [Gracilimonas sp.]
MVKKNLIQDKSFEFSLSIIHLYRKLVQQKEYIISKQLLRSGTSIGANIEEALAGFSKKDFIFKMSISSKEARETRYWLRLLKESDLTNINLDSYLLQIDEIINILTSIVKTTQSRNP